MSSRFSLSRIWTIATASFTQLARMKVFYFLVLFALLLVGVNFIRMNEIMGPEIQGMLELISLKSISLGAMQLFAVFFAIAATSLLIPRDMEDRTLYTILCKPVPRLDYLIGKWLGVVLLIGVCLAVMDLALSINLHFRTETVVAEQAARMSEVGFDAASQDRFLDRVREQGPSLSLQWGVATIWLEAMVMAAVALLISTVSSSTLFAMVASFCVYAIGLFQADARAVVLEGDSSWFQEAISRVVAYLFPDLQFYGVVDATARGEALLTADFARLAGISGVYVGIYLVLAWFMFSKKEF